MGFSCGTWDLFNFGMQTPSCGMCDLAPWSGNWAPCTGRAVLTTRPPGKSHYNAVYSRRCIGPLRNDFQHKQILKTTSTGQADHLHMQIRHVHTHTHTHTPDLEMLRREERDSKCLHQKKVGR